MTDRVIDVWDIESYDSALRGLLAANDRLITDYARVDREIDAEYRASRLGLRRDNPHAPAYYRLIDAVADEMRRRTIRGWHYSRLTDDEIERLLVSGLEPSSLDGLRRRLNARVAAADFTEEQAEAIYRSSPFHEQLGSRAGKIYMVAMPEPLEESGLEEIIGHWGGESAFFWQRDPQILALLQATGRAAIIEIAMPLVSSRHHGAAGQSAVHRFARSLGCDVAPYDFELYSVDPLPGSAIRAVHRQDDALFGRVGSDYPDRLQANVR